MIVERDGKKVKLSDLGVIVKDFIVSSVEFEEHHEDIEGMAGGVDNGVSIGRRSISVPVTFKSYDLLDFPLLRDELFELFHPSGYLYVQEMRRPKTLVYDFVDFGEKPKYEDGTENVLVGGKRYKVRIASPFDFEQFKTYGSTVLEFKTVGLPYSESVYTTKELNGTGYSALAEKYGLVDGINDEQVIYKFLTETKLYISNYLFKQGYLNLVSGKEATSVSEFFLISDFIEVGKSTNYAFKDIGNKSTRWWIYEYDEDKEYIGYISTDDKELKFKSKGKYLKFMVGGETNEILLPSYVSVSGPITPELENEDENDFFNIWNGGNVTVTPEQMFLNITATGASKDFEIINHTTGEHMILRGPHGGTFRTRGISYTMTSVPMLRYMTKKQFISLAPGLNNIEIIGTFRDIEFDFRFYYK